MHERIFLGDVGMLDGGTDLNGAEGGPEGCLGCE